MMQKPENFNDTTEKFNRWLEDELEERGWSLRELARRCGVTQPHLSMVRAGERTVTWEVVAAIADTFGYRKEYAFRLVGLLPGGKEKIDELIEIANYLPDGKLDEVINYAEWKRKNGN